MRKSLLFVQENGGDYRHFFILNVAGNTIKAQSFLAITALAFAVWPPLVDIFEEEVISYSLVVHVPGQIPTM